MGLKGLSRVSGILGIHGYLRTTESEQSVLIDINVVL